MNKIIKFTNCQKCKNKIAIHMVESPNSKVYEEEIQCDCGEQINIKILAGWTFVRKEND